MNYLLWSLLNLALLGYFVYLVYGLFSKGRKIFQNRLKPLSIIVVMFGLAQVLTVRHNDAIGNRRVIMGQYNGNGDVKLAAFAMEDGLSMNFFLTAKYAYEDDELFVIETNCELSGLTFGYTWDASKIVRLAESDTQGRAQYLVIGYLSWQLFGFELYREEKDFRGIIPKESVF